MEARPDGLADSSEISQVPACENWERIERYENAGQSKGSFLVVKVRSMPLAWVRALAYRVDATRPLGACVKRCEDHPSSGSRVSDP